MLAAAGRIMMILAAGLLLIVAVVQWQTHTFEVNGAMFLGMALFGLGAVVYLHSDEAHKGNNR